METKTNPMEAIEQLKDANTLGADIDILMFDFVPNIHVDIQCEIAATTKNRKAQGIFGRSRSIRIRRALASNPDLDFDLIAKLRDSKDTQTRENAWATWEARHEALQAA